MGCGKKSQQKPNKRGKRNVERIPPEGGWGWVIVAGYTLTTVVSIPIIQNFGLIFKQRLADLNLTSTDVTTIISLNSAIGQICGIAQGPLLKIYGYRIMAVFGVATFTLGTLLTGLSQSLLHFILTYGIITSIGFTYTLTSFSLAMSSYFRKKRSRASGLLMGFGGLGPVFMPPLVTYLLGLYGATQTSFLLAAINAHGFIGACLLRPVHWYAKEKYPEKKIVKKVLNKENIQDIENDLPTFNINFNLVDGPVEKDFLLRQSIANNRSLKDMKRPSIEMELFANGDGICGEHIGGIGSALGNRRTSRIRSISASDDNRWPEKEKELANLIRQCSANGSFFKTVTEEGSLSNSSEESDYYTCVSELNSTNDLQYKGNLKKMLASQETLDSVGSSMGIALMPSQTFDFDSEDDDESTEDEEEEEKISFGEYLKNLFDLDLLTESKYIIITLGLSIAVIGEIMFSLLLPFILAEVGLDMQETAFFMSTVGVADIISRFTSPYIGELIKFNSRVMYVLALFCLVFSRASLLFVSGKIGLSIVAIAIGFAKGVRTVFWIQVLPDHVEAKKLASAMSIQNLMNGIMILFAGPLSGKIVEINNSYLNIIYISNVLTGLTVLLWGGEYLVLRLIQYKKDKICEKQMQACRNEI